MKTALVLVFEINGPIDAKGSRYEAVCEQTITGVRWIIRGRLAQAISHGAPTIFTAPSHPIQEDRE